MQPQLFKGFLPLSTLWTGAEEAPPLFPSEASARWFLHQHRDELADARAIARDLGKLLVHPGRIGKFREDHAMKSARRAA